MVAIWEGALQPLVFVGFNAGFAGCVVGLVIGLQALALAGAALLSLAGLAYSAGTLRTLAFTVVDPPRPATPLVALP